MNKREQKIKFTKLITFNQEEWNYIQGYKHSNQLKSDTQAIKHIIMQDKMRIDKIIENSWK
jgi:hypothetical protein